MSDFVRIMRGWTAMCDKYSNCYPCPLNGKGACMRPINNRRVQDMIRTEQIVENWLKVDEVPRVVRFIERESRRVVARGWEDGGIRFLFNGYRISR